MAIQPGSILRGHYRIDALVGGGGMALVYRAFDLNLQRVCAIKQNLDSSPEAQQQFYVEAIVLANLSHPHLARVTDHFVDTTGQQYLVMDFVEGEDLASVVKRQGQIPAVQAQEWIGQVADALNYLHNRQPPAGDRDLHAFFRKRLGDSPANARAAARDECCFACESIRHEDSLN